MTPIDPFDVFRTTLFIGVAAYTLLTAVGTVWRVVGVLCGNDPNKKLLRTFLSYQLVTVRVRPVAGELLDLVLWLSVLLGIWWLHTRV